MGLPRSSEVNRLVRLWKKRLGLSGWEIGWKWEQQAIVSENTGYNCLASTGLDVAEMKALVCLSNSVEWTKDEFYSDHNLEDTVVHELLHVRMAAAEDRFDTIAKALATHLSPDEARLIGALVMETRERYIESARTLIQEAFQSKEGVEWKK